MRRGIFGTPVVPAFNAVAAKLIDVPLFGNVVRRNLVMISYVGRRSGETFTIPVITGGSVTNSSSMSGFPAPRTGGETSWAAAARLRCGSTAPTERGTPSRPATIRAG